MEIYDDDGYPTFTRKIVFDTDAEDSLLEFPSYPNLTLQNQKIFTKFTIMVCAVIHEHAALSSLISKSLYPYIFGTDIKTHEFMADFNIKLGEFLKLPEVAGLVYCINMVPNPSDENTYHHYYFSIYQKMEREKFDIFAFRVAIVRCINRCIQKGNCNKFGSVLFKDVCDCFNEVMKSQNGPQIQPGIEMEFLHNLTPEYFVANYCQRDVCIERLTPEEKNEENFNGKIGRLRLRGPKQPLLARIRSDKDFAKKAFKVYEHYTTEYRGFDWKGLLPEGTYMKSPQPAFKTLGRLIDNIYSVIHHLPNVKDYQTMKEAIEELLKQSLFGRITKITKTKADLLIDMLSLESYECIVSWKKEEQITYFKIMEDICSSLNVHLQNYIFEQHNTTLICPGFAQLSLFALGATAMHILMATNASNGFVTQQEIIEYVQTKHGYDVLKRLKKYKISSFTHFLKMPLFSKYLDSIITQKLNANDLAYRNLLSISLDTSFHGLFPYDMVYELVNMIEFARDDDYHENGYVREQKILEYYRCIRRVRDLYTPNEAYAMLGPDYATFANFKEFLETFNFTQIDAKVLSDNEYGYSFDGSSKDLLNALDEEQDKKLDAACAWARQIQTGMAMQEYIASEKFCTMKCPKYEPYEVPVPNAPRIECLSLPLVKKEYPKYVLHGKQDSDQSNKAPKVKRSGYSNGF